jgi:hypothetical protein
VSDRGRERSRARVAGLDFNFYLIFTMHLYFNFGGMRSNGRGAGAAALLANKYWGR